MKWVHLYLFLIIPFGTSYLPILMHLFAHRSNKHTSNYKSSTKILHIIYHLPMVCLYQFSYWSSLVDYPFLDCFRSTILIIEIDWYLFRSFYINILEWYKQYLQSFYISLQSSRVTIISIVPPCSYQYGVFLGSIGRILSLQFFRYCLYHSKISI